MSENRIMAIIRSLAKSQGYYGRLLANLENANEAQKASFFKMFRNCKDEIDFVMTLEG